MAAGTFITSNGLLYDIKHYKIPEDATETSQIIGEDLTAPGVNGKRVRHIRREFRPFPIMFMISATSVAQAREIKRQLQLTVQQFVTLSLTFAGLGLRWKDAHFRDARIRIVASNTVAADISSETHTVIVYATMHPTEDVR